MEKFLVGRDGEVAVVGGLGAVVVMVMVAMGCDVGMRNW